MVGDLQTASVRAVSELDALGLAREARGSAVDLGAGFGLYALPLAQRGYNVTAIDSCRILLDELESRAQGLPITAVRSTAPGWRLAGAGSGMGQPLLKTQIVVLNVAVRLLSVPADE